MKKAPLYTHSRYSLLLHFLPPVVPPERLAQVRKNSPPNAYGVTFYNIENLFDTHDDPSNTGDDEFLPTGSYRWTEAISKKAQILPT